ncbi:unnamed protein product, partial [Brenthis ino]
MLIVQLIGTLASYTKRASISNQEDLEKKKEIRSTGRYRNQSESWYLTSKNTSIPHQHDQKAQKCEEAIGMLAIPKMSTSLTKKI